MSDIFRQEYSPVSSEASAKVLEVKQKAQELYDSIDFIGILGVPGIDYRCLAVAKTELETAVMWAIKGLTANVSANPGVGAQLSSGPTSPNGGTSLNPPTAADTQVDSPNQG